MYRDYLPYESLRFYKDRGMLKWQGFFLSEHSSSLKDTKKSVIQDSSMTLEEKYLYLGQLYQNQLLSILNVRVNKELKVYKGTVSQIRKENIIFRISNNYLQISINDIIDINVEENFYG